MLNRIKHHKKVASSNKVSMQCLVCYTVYIPISSLQIPANTNVLINAFYLLHNPEIYDEPFTVKPERFLDEDGKFVEAGHPARHKYATAHRQLMLVKFMSLNTLNSLY